MAFLSEKAFPSTCMHLYTKVGEKINHRRVVFTQQDTIYSRAHLVLTNLLITSLLVLCFSRWSLLFLPPNILLISCHPRLLFWYLLFRYRWAHHLCFLSMNDLSRSSFFDLSIYLVSSVFFPMISFVSASKISFDFLSTYRLWFWYLQFGYRWAHVSIYLSIYLDFGAQQRIWVVGFVENLTVWPLDILWVVVLGCWMLKIRQHQVRIDTCGGTIMRSEFCAVQ